MRPLRSLPPLAAFCRPNPKSLWSTISPWAVSLVALVMVVQPWAMASAQDASRSRQKGNNEDEVFPPSPQLMPDDTLAFFRISDTKDVAESWPTTSMGKMMADPALKPFVSDTYQTASEIFDELGSALGITLDELVAIPQGQISAALMPRRFSEEDMAELDGNESVDSDEDPDSEEAIRRRLNQRRRRQNSFAGLFVIEAGENIDTLVSLIDKAKDSMREGGYVDRDKKIDGVTLNRLLPPRRGRVPLESFVYDGVMVIGLGHDTAGFALKQLLGQSDEKTLAQRSDYVALMSRCVGEESTRPQVTFYADPYHLIERLFKSNSTAGLIWPIVEDLGIKRLRGIGGSIFSGGEIFESMTHFHIAIDPPRDGFFGVIRPETEETLPPDWVPSDVTSYTSFGWRMDVTYENLEKIVVKFLGGQPFSEVVEKPVTQATGLSLREDVIDNLKGRVVFIRWLQKPIKVNSMVTAVALELKDVEAAKEVVAKIREKRSEWLEPEAVGSTTTYRFPGPSRENFPDSLRKPEPAMFFLDNWLISTDSPEMIQQLVNANKGSVQRLNQDVDYEIVLGELSGLLDGEEPFMVSYLRGDEFVRQGYELIQSDDTQSFIGGIAAQNPTVGKLADLLKRNDLPDFQDMRKYFAPSGSYMYDEPGGIHYADYTLRSDED